jgi:hypothetical protein
MRHNAMYFQNSCICRPPSKPLRCRLLQFLLFLERDRLQIHLETAVDFYVAVPPILGTTAVDMEPHGCWAGLSTPFPGFDHLCGRFFHSETTIDLDTPTPTFEITHRSMESNYEC